MECVDGDVVERERQDVWMHRKARPATSQSKRHKRRSFLLMLA
jgi:hypothetical protein